MLSRILTEIFNLYDKALAKRTQDSFLLTKLKDTASWAFNYTNPALTISYKDEFIKAFKEAEKTKKGWIDIICNLGDKGHTAQLDKFKQGSSDLSEFTLVANAARSFLLYIAEIAEDDEHELWKVLAKYPEVREIARVIRAERDNKIKAIHKTINLEHQILQRSGIEAIPDVKEEIIPKDLRDEEDEEASEDIPEKFVEESPITQSDIVPTPERIIAMKKACAEESIMLWQQYLCYLHDKSFLSDINEERILLIFKGHVMGGDYKKEDREDISQLDVSRHVILQNNLFAIAIRRYTDLKKTKFDLGVITTFVSSILTKALKESKDAAPPKSLPPPDQDSQGLKKKDGDKDSKAAYPVVHDSKSDGSKIQDKKSSGSSVDVVKQLQKAGGGQKSQDGDPHLPSESPKKGQAKSPPKHPSLLQSASAFKQTPSKKGKGKHQSKEREEEISQNIHRSRSLSPSSVTTE